MIKLKKKNDLILRIIDNITPLKVIYLQVYSMHRGLSTIRYDVLESCYFELVLVLSNLCYRGLSFVG